MLCAGWELWAALVAPSKSCAPSEAPLAILPCVPSMGVGLQSGLGMKQC